MEKVRPWCGQPSDRGRLKNRTEQNVQTLSLADVSRDFRLSRQRRCVNLLLIAGQLNTNMQHNRANGDTSTKIGVMTP